MPPKTPKQLREEIEKQNEQPATPGHSRTAEGLEIPDPKRSELFGNLEKATESDK